MATVPINWASVRNGAFAVISPKSDDNPNWHSNIRELCLLDDNVDDDNYTDIPSFANYTIQLIKPVLVDTFIIRFYAKDGRTYTLSLFQTSADGVEWRDVVPSGTQYFGTVRVEFDPRLVQYIRMQGLNTTNEGLHMIRFQAFNTRGQ